MADDLSGIIDSTSRQLRLDSLNFQTRMAQDIVDASDGALTGFTVTRTDDDSTGVHQTETTFDRATRNLNLAADMNPDLEAAAIRVSRERGIPRPLARALDNREVEKPDLENAAPETLAFLGNDLSNAAVSKDDVAGIDNIVEAAQYAAMSPEDRRDSLLGSIKQHGYSPSQLADLKAAGFSPLPEDPDGSTGTFSVDAASALNAKAHWPVLTSWYSGPGEEDQERLEKEAAERFDKVIRHGFDNVRGSAWLANTTPETAKKYIQTLDEEIVTMQGLYALYGDGWKAFNDEELASAIGEVGNVFGFDSSRVSPARLRPAGIGWETDWEQVFNVFGTVSAYESRTRLNPEELDQVHRDPLSFSYGDRAELVDYLEEQARALRGKTGWNQTVDITLGSLKFATELAATSGVSAAPSALKALMADGWLRGVPRVIGSLARGELHRLPAYAPQLGRETVEESRAQVSQVIRDGAVLPGMTEAQTSEVANIFFNKVANTYIENFSEGLGVLFPGSGRLLRPLTKAIPQRLKNAAFAQVANRVLRDVAVSKGAKVAGIVYERSMFNGLLGEYAEEKWGDAIRAASTELARTIGTPFGDFGQDSVFGSLEDELQLMGSLAVTGAVLQSVRIPTAVGDIRRAVRFMDAHRAVHTAVEEAKITRRSPETLEHLLQYYTSGANTAYLSPEGARTLFQSAPELMGRIGVSEDMIGEAELKERMIPVSMAKVHAHVSRAELDTLLVKLVPDPKSVLTPEEAAKVKLDEEARKVAEETDRVRAETKAAYDEAIQKMMALNRPASEIRATARLLSMANYFAAESNMSAADFIRGLDFQSMKFQDWLARQSKGAESLLQAVGDKFRTIRDALPEETGETPLFKGKFSSVRQVLPDLAETFNRFPDGVTAADGKKVLVKNPEGGSVAKRLMHLIAGVDENSGDRNSFEFSNKIAWIPRIVETVENAQVKLRDPQTGNYAYVRSYSEGVIHSVVVTKNGVVADTETFDHGLITQFAAKYAGRRGEFTVVWERTDGDSSSAPTSANGSQGNDPSALTSKEDGGKRSPQSPSTGESSGDAPYSPSAGTNVAPSLKNVKLLQGDAVYRGATTFTDNWNAMITLFEGEADASTLVHEIGHYATEMMRHLVESGAAGERMQRDYATLTEWATRGTNDPAEQRERLARAFEAYCMEGKAPSIELEGAFATLRRLLLHVYRSVKALGVELSDDVRKVFDGMLATDATIRQESFLREAAMEIDKELLGLSQPEIRTFRELIAKANDQAVQKLTAEKNAQLAKLRPQWRKEANALMDGEPVYNAWRSIRKAGGINYAALEEICGERAAGELRKRGLTAGRGNKGGRHPASFVSENGFASVEEMVDALLQARSPQSFVESYMTDAEARFNEAFEASEAAQSVNASIEALEKLSELLAVKGGRQGYRIRKALLRQRAREEIDAMPVGKVVSDKQLISDCRTNARKLTQAANRGDFTAAFEEAKALRYNLEVLRVKGDAKHEVERVEKLLSRGRHAKKGAIYGDHQEALTDLSVRFGFTRTQPKRPLRHTVASVVEEFNEEAEANGDARLEVPSFLLSGSGPYRELSFAEFQQLGMLADFLYGEGKSLVSARETAFREQVKTALEGCVSELEGQPHKYTKSDNPLVYGYRSLIQQGTKLRNIIGMAAKWKKDSVLQGLYDDMAYAESEQTQLMTDPMRAATEAMDALYRSTRELPLDTIRDIPFPADVIAEGYRKWDAEKVVAACLNMGNAKNRQRLIDGYEWGENGEAYCDRIAALLTADDWANIQKIWDAINGNLAHRVAQTYREEYHHDLAEEPALPFQVTTADGRTLEVAGGYYPLDYLYHKNSIVRNREEAQSNYNPPAFRRASFTFERAEKLSDPLRLSLNLVYEHLFDAAHYVSHRATMRKVLRVVNDTTFRKHFEQTQGFERYRALKALVENVAAPGAALKGMTSDLEAWSRSVLTATSLWASPGVVFMQTAGVTFGLDELGSYYFSALRDIAEHPLEAYRFVMSHSGMMRDRVNLKDLDLKTRTNQFRENFAEQTRRTITEIGYAPMRYVDLCVATPIWLAAYNQAVDRGADMPHAVAQADEFVAKTQGATRPIDMSPIQLKPWLRGCAVFFSAVSAGATMGTKALSRIKTGGSTPMVLAAAVAANILAPQFLSSLVRSIIAGPGDGDDDPDRMMRAFFKELVTQPFSGIPFVRDVADAAAKGAFDKHGYSTRVFFENSSLRGLNEVAVSAYESIAAAFDENPDRAIYKLADAMGTLFRVPVVGAYERIRRTLSGWIDDPDFMPDFNKETRRK